MEKTVTAVIVTFNRKELLIESIKAILAGSTKVDNILVVDNCSTDGTEEYLKKNGLLEKIIYRKLASNIGGAGGFNYGIREAIKLDSYYIWIMDDDCIAQKDTLTNLLRAADRKNDNFGFLSSQVRWTDGSPCVMNVQRTSLSKEIADFNHEQKVVLASFVSLFLKAESVEEVGLPFKEFFIWGDDWEYTYRMSRRFDCYYIPSSKVIHKSLTNKGVDIAHDNERLDRYFYAYRNEGFFYKQAGFRGKFYYFLKVLYHRLKIKGENKKEKLEIIKKGKKAIKTFNPKKEVIFRPSRKLDVMEFFGEDLAFGGQESFMINMYRHFEDNSSYTFVTPFALKNTILTDLVDKRHDKIIFYNFKDTGYARKRSIVKAIKKAIRDQHVDVIHIQSSSLFAILNAAKIARKNNIKKIIVHSHAGIKDSFKYRLIKKMSDRKIDRYVDIYLACSKVAAIAKFPKEIIDKNQYQVILNGIEIDNFKFDETKRDEYRKELNVQDDEILLCSVARLAYQKNHQFILDVCKKLSELGFKYKCIIAGSGELENDLKLKIMEYKLDKEVKLLGQRNDANYLMMASDYFLIPSFFEGLAVSSVESQATGLYTLISDTITDESKISDIIKFLPINSIEPWVEEIKNKKVIKNREKYAEIVAKSGFNSKDSAALLEKIYRGNID